MTKAVVEDSYDWSRNPYFVKLVDAYAERLGEQAREQPAQALSKRIAQLEDQAKRHYSEHRSKMRQAFMERRRDEHLRLNRHEAKQRELELKQSELNRTRDVAARDELTAFVQALQGEVNRLFAAAQAKAEADTTDFYETKVT